MNPRGAFVCIPLVLALASTGRAAAPTKDQCIDANEAGQVSRKGGKLLRAREQFQVCVMASCPDVIRNDCSSRLKDLEAAIPSALLKALDRDGRDLADGVRVLVDGGRELGGQDLTLPLANPVDLEPGQHEIVFIHDSETLKRSIVLREGQKGEVIAVVFGEPQKVEKREPKPIPVLPIGLGGVGVIALGIGTVFGLNAISKNSDSNANGHCDTTGCDPYGKGLRNDARSDATVSTIAFVLGLGAVAAGGVVLYLGSQQEKGPRVGLRPSGNANGGALHVVGSW